tara:strand:+ start:20965 stop:21936 length:972 start_codon:yes stop_codon:yes gene_type:complete
MAIILLSGCGESNTGASAEQIASAFGAELSAGMIATNASIETEENFGSAALPEVQTRAVLDVVLTEDFYERTGTLGGYGIDAKDVLRKTADEGQVIRATVVSTATRRGESWDIQFERVDMARVEGMALSQYGVNSYVLDGSDEFLQLEEEVEAARLVAIEEERAQLEAQALREEEQRLRREAEAEEARLEAVAFRRSMSGIWESSLPVEYDGQPYVGRSNRVNYTIHYRVSIPQGDDLRGQASITLFARSEGNTAGQEDIVGVFEFDTRSRSFILNEIPEGNYVGWVIGKGWTMTPDGTETLIGSGTYRGRSIGLVLNKVSSP